MKISACVITKNEEKNIAGYLKSIQPFVDEVILVDTGSCDHTIAVANKHNIRVYSFAWQGDFSAAKNFALSKASGDWIVFLDADEFFSPETIRRLPDIIRRYGGAYDAFLGKMVNIDIENENKVMDYFYTVRIFRHLPSIVYAGKIHEQIVKTNGEKLKIKLLADDELLIYHTGYSQSLGESKAKRNLEMLLTELEQTKTPEQYYVYLAEAYFGIGDDKKAIYYAVLDIESGKKELTYASRPYRILIESTKNLAYPAEERQQIIELAMASFPELPDFCAEYGLLFYQNGDQEKACTYFRKALDLNSTYRGIEPSLLNNSLPLLRELLQNAEARLGVGVEKEMAGDQAYQYAEPLHQKLKENEISAVYEQGLLETAKLLQKYTIMLLQTAQVEDLAWESKVPKGIERIIHRCQGKELSLTADDIGNYKSLLIAVLGTEDRALIKKYLAISLDFPKEVRLEILKNLPTDTAADYFAVMASDFADDDFTDDKICYILGKYHYQMRNDECAKSFFAKAIKLGSSERSIASYLKWIEERG